MHYDERRVLDSVFTVGNYLMLAMGINAFGVQLDDDYEGFHPGPPHEHVTPLGGATVHERTPFRTCRTSSLPWANTGLCRSP